MPVVTIHATHLAVYTIIHDFSVDSNAQGCLDHQARRISQEECIAEYQEAAIPSATDVAG